MTRGRTQGLVLRLGDVGSQLCIFILPALYNTVGTKYHMRKKTFLKDLKQARGNVKIC